MNSQTYERVAGHESLSAFIKTTARTIQENSFSHILAASDSGQLSSRLVQYVYSELQLLAPPVIALPIFRHVDKERTKEFDNTVIAEQYGQWRNAWLGHCLFADDEIWHGVTLRGYIDVLNELSALPTQCTVMAEDGGFKCPSALHGVPMKFIPIKQRVSSIYNSFSHTIPEHIFEVLAVVDFANDKQRMCALLDLPVKSREEDTPNFSYSLIDQCTERVSNFSELQSEYSQRLVDIVKESCQ